MLGEVFDGNGVVIAPAQKGERALWDVITVALVAPGADEAERDTSAPNRGNSGEAAGQPNDHKASTGPSASADQNASPTAPGNGPGTEPAAPKSTLNGVITRATAALREAGQNFETLQRRELTVDHNPAQMLKVRYRENSSGHDWIEELVFIQGPENEIYSVALKCAPEHLTRLEPALQEVLASWRLRPPE